MTQISTNVAIPQNTNVTVCVATTRVTTTAIALLDTRAIMQRKKNASQHSLSQHALPSVISHSIIYIYIYIYIYTYTSFVSNIYKSFSKTSFAC